MYLKSMMWLEKKGRNCVKRVERENNCSDSLLYLKEREGFVMPMANLTFTEINNKKVVERNNKILI
jgi:hypothetical protein